MTVDRICEGCRQSFRCYLGLDGSTARICYSCHALSTPEPQLPGKARLTMTDMLVAMQKGQQAVRIDRLKTVKTIDGRMPMQREIDELKAENKQLRQNIDHTLEALATASAQNVEANQYIVNLTRQLEAHVAHAALPSDPPQGGDFSPAAADKKGQGAADPIIDKAIDRLGERKVSGESAVSPQDRGKLQDALNTANAPRGGQEGQNDALRRAIRFGH